MHIQLHSIGTLILGFLFSHSLSAQVVSYAYDEPSTTFAISEQLEEISGLTIANGQLIAIQDEEGKLFFLNMASGSIERELPFWKEGDYEGVTFAEDGTIWVVKSTGTLYAITEWQTNTPQVTKYNTHLSKDQDVEGLAYDALNNRLLLACKGEAIGDGDNDAYDFSRAIYSFSLSSLTVSEVPLYLISLDDVCRFLKAHKSEEENEDDFDKFFDEDRDDLPFAPSGIAIHPTTGYHYILSSKGRFMMVLTPNGRILDIQKLSKKVLRQPEGMIFDQQGNLYISSEAKKDDPPCIQYYSQLR